MKFKFIADIKKAQLIFDSIGLDVKEAATDAMDEVGAEIKQKGRANIASAGFGKRWQNALRVNRYPTRGVSANAALWIFHNIPYADVFESGATIRGKPLLWIPLSSAPQKIGGKKMTPKEFVASVGPLFSVNRPGKAPLLMAKFGGNSQGRVSLAGLRKGASQGGVAVPVFVGVTSVNLRKRFNLRPIFAASAARLGTIYEQKLKR